MGIALNAPMSQGASPADSALWGRYRVASLVHRLLRSNRLGAG